MHGSLRRTFIPRGVWQPKALLTPEITGTTDRIQSTPRVSMCGRSFCSSAMTKRVLLWRPGHKERFVLHVHVLALNVDALEN
jgi:hypothetical protein